MIRRKLFRLKLNSRTLVLGERTLVMGVLNVTPDSFSDGGKFLEPESAIERAFAIERAGADLLDIGGESTRPGSADTPASEELNRILPVLEALRGRLKIPISVDTRRASVAELALRAGAELLNNVFGVKNDPQIAEVAVRHRVPLILMHMRGEPHTMQTGRFARDVMKDVMQGLRKSLSIRGSASARASPRITNYFKNSRSWQGSDIRCSWARRGRVSLARLWLGTPRRHHPRSASGEPPQRLPRAS